MQLSKFKEFLLNFSTIRPNNYTLKVNRRDRTTVSSSNFIMDITEFVNKYTLIKDGIYVLTTYDSAKLSDSARGLLGRLTQNNYEDYQDTDKFNLRLNVTEKGLDVYLYDTITFSVNKIDSIELWSTNSKLFRWGLKLINKI